MEVYTFEKNGIKFSFRNPRWEDFYKQLRMEWKVIGVRENNCNDGYFYNSIFLVDKNAMTLNEIKMNGKNIKGVILPDDILAKIKTLYEQYREEGYQKRLNQDIKYTMNDEASYGINNGISEFDISVIVMNIKKQYNSDIALFSKDIAKILNKDKELKLIAEQSYQPCQDENWNDNYLNWFREAAKKKEAPGYGTIPNKIIKKKITDIILKEMEKENKRNQKGN